MVQLLYDGIVVASVLVTTILSFPIPDLGAGIRSGIDTAADGCRGSKTGLVGRYLRTYYDIYL